MNIFYNIAFHCSANFVYTYYSRWIWLFSSMKNCRVHLNEKSKNEQKWTIISLCVLFFKDEDNKNDCYQIADFKISFQRLSFYWNCILQACFSWRCILGCWLVNKISLFFIWHIIAEKACTQLKPPKSYNELTTAFNNYIKSYEEINNSKVYNKRIRNFNWIGVQWLYIFEKQVCKLTVCWLFIFLGKTIKSKGWICTFKTNSILKNATRN